MPKLPAARVAALAGLFLFLAPAGAVADGARPLSDDEARHFLVRTGFSARPEDIAALRGVSRAEAVRRLFAGVRHEALTPPPGWANGPVTLRPPPRANEEERRMFQAGRRQEAMYLVSWWYREMATTPSPFTERMTLFWHNHFATAFNKVRATVLLYRQNALLRRHALGDFRALLHAAIADPAMILYLDSQANRKGQPNENLARELMELFTLGEGRGYTERDVKEAARAFTGWSIDAETGTFRFRPALHDDGEKTVLGKTGRLGGKDVIEILLAAPRTAEHIAEKAWREFVSERPDPAEIRRIAGAFRAARYDLKVLMREILLAPAFWAAENRGRLVRSPVELVVGTARLFEVELPEGPPLVQMGRALGQEIFNPPNVKGWPGHTAWITGHTLIVRQQILRRMLAGGDAAAPGNGPGMAERPMAERPMAGRPMGGVDLDAWYEKLPPDAKRPAALVALLVPIKPLNPPSGTSDPARFVRDLVLDPTYQLK
jgi:uncharacterized protein (DUF1800 family)